jgi:hypothetical protein
MSYFLWVFSMDEEQEKRLHLFAVAEMNSIPTSCWLVHATVSNPDLDWIKIKSDLWIWIQESKNDPKKKVKKFHVLLCWVFSLGGLKLLL